jgi:hypothetical protein
VLENPELTKNQYINILSFLTSQAELLSVIERLTGEKYAVTNITSQEVIARGNAKLKKQDYSGIADLLQGAAFGKAGLGDYRDAGLWNEKLGLKGEESVKVALSGKLVGEE